LRGFALVTETATCGHRVAAFDDDYDERDMQTPATTVAQK
jgi:hypothetical protein